MIATSIMPNSSDSLREVWTRHASTVARKINLAWWIETLSVPLVVVGLLGACALLLIRRELPNASPLALAGSTAGVVALLGGIAWLIARRRFEHADQSMVRIEASMRLRNALSAAKAGVSPWPDAPKQVDAGVEWHWQRVLIPPVAALAFLTAGLFIPVSAKNTEAAGQSDQPLAWQNLDADLERLDQEEVIDEEYIEEMRKKLEELRAQEEEDWFSHSSLEATDSLKKEHAGQVEKLSRELERADRALSNLQKNAGAMSPAEKDQLLNQFDQALQGLQNGALKPNPQLLDKLEQLDPNNLGQMNPQQLQQLRENMKKAGQACKDCQGGGAGDEWQDELLDGQGNGGNGGEGDGPESAGAGNGGITRGPGHSPGVLGKEGDRIEIGDLEGLESKDLSNSLPGDLLQLQDGEHDVDKSPVGRRAGGTADAMGDGGDRVWKDALDPDEQKALKKFFE